ncbi:hypothetical protein EIN_018970 [Entamoeba invadens IP1]|uniref:hypothetical protein n=1 Tax=Entamoeba invadens IP1 TaxID=370355 RepID=UPI0002C3D7A0|nr:hypothetical protein EIN_018970 [Entamoeba invadens IP1]ELP90528.1 hypothetical protein EIN_018970 [Entamoeba invadens IP1]|eukprot:XP_004257299.1 hypothetical protein EIN_018970 [Entamoeba invadens IP1]
MEDLIDITKLTLSLPTASAHFPAMSNAVDQWNSINSAIRLVMQNVPHDMAPSELLGLFYRFSGTLAKYAKKLEGFAATPKEWTDIRAAYNMYIEKYTALTKDDVSVNPEQFVFNLARAKLGEALQKNEDCKLQQLPITENVKKLFIESDQLFGLLLEWCDKEEESTMVMKFVELIKEVISGF